MVLVCVVLLVLRKWVRVGEIGVVLKIFVVFGVFFVREFGFDFGLGFVFGFVVDFLVFLVVIVFIFFEEESVEEVVVRDVGVRSDLYFLKILVVMEDIFW